MSGALDHYLAQAYRRDVLRESVVVEMPVVNPALIAETEAAIARIDALRLGANLANRDFASFQNRRALLQFKAQLQAQEAQALLPPPQEAP